MGLTLSSPGYIKDFAPELLAGGALLPQRTQHDKSQFDSRFSWGSCGVGLMVSLSRINLDL